MNNWPSVKWKKSELIEWLDNNNIDYKSELKKDDPNRDELRKLCCKIKRENKKEKSSNVKKRDGSTRNAIAKDIAKRFGPTSTELEVEDRNNILNYNPSKCYLCDLDISNEQSDLDHFVNSCNTKNKIYGADNDLNKLRSCKDCNGKKNGKTFNQTKEWLRKKYKNKMKNLDEDNAKDLEQRIENKIKKLEEFYNKYKDKLQCGPDLVEIIEMYFKKSNNFHYRFHESIINAHSIDELSNNLEKI